VSSTASSTACGGLSHGYIRRITGDSGHGSEPAVPFSDPLISSSARSWFRAIPCPAMFEQRHKIIHNRVALGGEESVSGVSGGSGPSSQPGEPIHAHLHHRQ